MMRPGAAGSCSIMLVAVVALAVGETAALEGDEAGRPHPAAAGSTQAVAVARNGWIVAGLVLLLVHLGLYMLALQECRPELRTAADRGVLSAGRAAGAVLSPRRRRHVARARHAPDHGRAWRSSRSVTPRRTIERAATGSAGAVAGAAPGRSRRDRADPPASLPSGRADRRRA